VQGVRATAGRLPRLPRRQEHLHPRRAQLTTSASVWQLPAMVVI
jgi:hypothetical protein